MLDNRRRAIDNSSVQIQQNSLELMPLHWRLKCHLIRPRKHDGGADVVVEPKIIEQCTSLVRCDIRWIGDVIGQSKLSMSMSELRVPFSIEFRHID